MQNLLTFLFLSSIILSCDMVIGMSKETEINSGPGGLVNPSLIGGENRSPIATGAASSSRLKIKGGIIYKATNSVNGKVYIGKTVKKLKKRIASHIFNVKSNNRNSAFHAAIRKYGLENFKWEIIDGCIFPDMLLGLEKYYIKKLNCKVPGGYNLTDGGRGVIGYRHTKEALKKISKSKIGENHPMFGKHHTKETKEKLREIALRRTGRDSAMFGKHHSEATKEKLRLKLRGNKNAIGGEKIK